MVKASFSSDSNDSSFGLADVIHEMSSPDSESPFAVALRNLIQQLQELNDVAKTPPDVQTSTSTATSTTTTKLNVS